MYLAYFFTFLKFFYGDLTSFYKDNLHRDCLYIIFNIINYKLSRDRIKDKFYILRKFNNYEQKRCAPDCQSICINIICIVLCVQYMVHEAAYVGESNLWRWTYLTLKCINKRN